MTRTWTIRAIIILICAALAGLPLSSDALAQQGGKKKQSTARKTGFNGRNVRIRQAGSSIEIMRGYIDKVEKNSIVMDGEHVSLAGVKITDKQTRRMHKKNLYPGLKVEVIYELGRPKSLLLIEPHRVEVVTDPDTVRRLEDMHLKMAERVPKNMTSPER